MTSHAQWKEALSLWLATFDRASLRFESYQQLKAVWETASGWNVDRVPSSKLRSASQKGPLDIYVFDIKGTECRIITWINTRAGTIFIKSILSHAEYDRWCRNDVR
ncbi:type II toxin-antitoxin system HigB family toxin [Pantoea sp. Ap-967]|nr:type II toxin-antitoxin system HigB family toxin [Pantoea sp. Ap-967]